MNIARHLVFLLLVLVPVVVRAQIGATEAELTKAWGDPVTRAMQNVMVMGKLLPSFPKLTYHKDDWKITGVMVGERCEKITYDQDQDGLWSADRFAWVLAENAQGATWTYDPKVSKLPTVRRGWVRSDGATGEWRKNLGLTVTTPAFVAAEAEVKDKARNHIKVLPKK